MPKLLTFLGWPLLVVPVVILYLGSFLNQIVIAANYGMMPVEVGSCYQAASQAMDDIHSCMLKNSRLKWLADWIFVGDGWESPGDMLVFLGNWIQAPLFYSWLTLLLICTLLKRNFWLE